MVRKDLDYLQWLQQNARMYLTAMAILTFLIALSFYLFFSDPMQPQKESVAFLTNRETEEQAVAEQDIPDDADDAVQNHGQTEPSTNEAPQQPQQSAAVVEESDGGDDVATEEEVQEQAPVKLTVDPTQFAGYTAPCNGPLVYGYGIGYDPVYADYRFHDRLCYQSEDGQVMAAQSGIVQTAALEQPEQLVVQYGSYTMIYSGLQTCQVAAGDSITAGQSIGTTEQYLYLQAVKASE